MAKTEVQHFSKPDEVRAFPKGRVEIVKIGGVTSAMAVLVLASPDSVRNDPFFRGSLPG